MEEASVGGWVEREREGQGDVERAPDFNRYIHTRTLSEQDIGLGDPDRRVILVGDLHGMNESLHDLLTSLSYNPSADTLIHVGDLVQKGPMSGSVALLDFLASKRIYGVRGNHDQPVVQWRLWFNWIEAQKGGKEWLRDIERKHRRGELNAEEKRAMKKRKGKWWSKVPKGWKMFGVHYRIAREISDEHYDYLVSLPLVLHIPSQHMYVVHGGLLPYNPKRPMDHPKQPLAHLPSLTSRHVGSVNMDEEEMRVAQEVELLTKVPQNTDPWVVMNVRSVTDSGKITRKSKKGTPWTKLWNKTVKKCAGFDVTARKGKKRDELPCMPSTVVYGHTASRGLDVHRWSVGLDSGCAHGRRLTALVLSGAELASSLQASSLAVDGNLTSDALAVQGDDYPIQHLEDDEDDEQDNRDEDDDDDPDWDDEEENGKKPKDATKIPFGDDGIGRLYSVKCHTK
ncbi:Metallo-dependent phosphatase, partial [Gloeophyllum trabeum ATCC 11539]